jgi:ABC-type branched-subunit amino acid transport system substrate-binding protein
MSIKPQTSVRTARDLPRVNHPSIPDTFGLHGRLLIGTSDAKPEDASVVRIGFLSDMPTGSSLAEYLDPIILAFEDAIVEGRLQRQVELLATHVVGLPVGREENVVAAFHDLLAQGCVLVLSTGVTNNALVLRDQINAALVPYVTMAGTTRFTGPYCFSLANGGHGEEAAILAAYLAAQGHRRVVLTGESSPGDEEYRRFFVDQASLYGVEILEAHYFDNDADEASLDAVLSRFRGLDPDALAYCGFGFNSRQLNPALARIGWAPPKIMNAAIMWALASPEWAAALDGWIGIDQTNNDHDDIEKNRNWVAMLDRFESRFGRRADDTMTALLYDQGRAVVEAIANAPTLDGTGLALGLERIKMMPSTLGGPRTYIGFGPDDHRGYRGDFMFMKQLRDGTFHFASYHWPEWPINQPT